MMQKRLKFNLLLSFFIASIFFSCNTTAQEDTCVAKSCPGYSWKSTAKYAQYVELQKVINLYNYSFGADSCSLVPCAPGMSTDDYQIWLQIAKLYYATKNGGGVGGAYVPLGGTDYGKPLTNSVEFHNSNPAIAPSVIYSKWKYNNNFTIGLADTSDYNNFNKSNTLNADTNGFALEYTNGTNDMAIYCSKTPFNSTTTIYAATDRGVIHKVNSISIDSSGCTFNDDAFAVNHTKGFRYLPGAYNKVKLYGDSLTAFPKGLNDQFYLPNTASVTINGNSQALNKNPSFTVSASAPYALSSYWSGSSITNATTQYFGLNQMNGTTATFTTVVGLRNFNIIQGSKVTGSNFSLSISGGSPSFGTSASIYLTDITTATDYLINTISVPVGLFVVGTTYLYPSTGLNIPINNTDIYTFKVVSAFGTNVTCAANYYLIIQ